MAFVHPAILWLLPLALLPVALLWQHRMVLRPAAAALVTVLRALTLACIVLALAQPVLERRVVSWTRVNVVDVSDSVSDASLTAAHEAVRQAESKGPAGDGRRLVVFDRHARVVDPSALTHLGSLRAAESASDAGAPGSALAAALTLADGLIPTGGGGEVQLYTDGWETTGDAWTAAWRLAQRGIAVRTIVPAALETPEVVLESVSAPASARVGASIQLTATVSAAQPGAAQLSVQTPGGHSVAVPCTLRAGRQQITCPLPLTEEGVQSWNVRVVAASDTRTDNNALPLAVRVRPPQQIGVVEANEDGSAQAALQTLLGLAAHVEHLAPSALADSAVLSRLDAVVIADTPADELTAEAQQTLREAVMDGLGLVVTGGRRAFAAGGYAAAPLQEMLPVSCTQTAELRDPSTTLVVIIDTSGSMGGGRVELAKEVARLAMARLKPYDKVGIVEFYGSKRWAAPIQSAGNAIDLQRALNRLSASGGTVILPAIEEAYYALLNVRTRTKHVLVLTDGGVESGAFEPLIRQMADKGITLSSVLVGPGGHSAFLTSLAQWGRGHYYAAHDRFNLPEVILKQPQNTLLPPFVEHAAALSAARVDPVLEGVDCAAAPPLAGHNLTEARPTADVVLNAGPGQPILARWQYGLGTVVTYATQLAGDWTAALAAWPSYATLWSNIIRAAGSGRGDTLQIVPRVRPDGLEVEVRAARLDGAATSGPLTLHWAAAAGIDEARVLDPLEPGRWNALLSGVAPGTYAFSARTAAGGLTGEAAVAITAAREVPGVGVNQTLLDELTALRTVAAQRAQERAGQKAVKAVELWPALTLAALAGLLLSVLVRRLPVSLGYARLAVRATGAAAVLLLVAYTPRAAGAVATTTNGPAAASRPVAEATQAATEAILNAIGSGDSEKTAETVAEVCRATLAQVGTLDPLITALQAQADTSPAVNRWLARVALRNGDLPLARDLLRQAAAGADPAILFELGCVEEQLADDPAALQAFTQVLAQTHDPQQRFALQVRCALLAYDTGDVAAGAAALRALADGGGQHTAAGQLYAAQLAGLLGDHALAGELVSSPAPAEIALQERLFRGHWQLHARHPEQAMEEFRAALRRAALPRDRRFICERIIAAARESGQVEALRAEWLTAPAASPEEMRALVELLRASGRAEDALAVLQRLRAAPALQDPEEAAALEREVLSLAAETGQSAAAEAAYRAQMAREPDQIDWPVGLARLFVLDDRTADAQKVLEEALAQYTDGPHLLALAEAIGNLGFDELACAAARKGGVGTAVNRVASVLLEAELVRRRGDADRSLQLLDDAVALAHGDDALLLRVAEAFERYGAKGRALELFKQIEGRTGGEDVLLRVVGLLEASQRYEEACTLWRRLWENSANAARVAQAQERLLDLAAQTGTLADLAIDLEEQLAGGRAPRRVLQLLVRIYTTANDPVSAAEILHLYAQQSGQETEALRELARVYLACNQFGRCRRILEQLTTRDPNNAADYVQQITILALERKRPAEAVEALERLRDVAADSPLTGEFAAGVLALAGLNNEAAAQYGQLLAQQPDRIETLLLWGAAVKAGGQAPRAIARFLQLAEEADADDLFTVAIDGLLNLEAPPGALRAGLRRVYSRIAAAPDKLFLYRLAADLHEALGRAQEMRRVLEQAVLVAGEQRGPLLRELMDSAKADGDDAGVVEFGRALLALAEELPPQVLLDLGDTLLNQGEVARAAHTFARAAGLGDYITIQQRIASLYEDADRPADAERVLRLLLVAQPDGVPLLVRLAGLSQQLEAESRAFTLYWRAIDLLLGRLPTAAQATTAASASGPTGPTRSGPRPRATNVDELGQSFDLTVAGLLQVCSSPEQQSRLLDDVAALARTELAALDSSGAPGATIAAHPRLEKTLELVQLVAFGLRAPDVADEAASGALRAFPTDKRLRRSIVQQRVEWGLDARAQKFSAADEAPPELPVELRAAQLASDPNGLLEAASFPVPAAVGALPLLIATDQDAAARRVLARLLEQPPPEDLTHSAPILLAASLALGEADAFTRWTLAWLEAARRLPAAQVVNELQACVRATWSQLDDAGRTAVVQRISTLAEGLEPELQTRVRLLALRLARAAGVPLLDADAVLAAAAQLPTLPPSDTAQLLALVTPEQRPELLQQVVTARSAAGVRAFLLELGGQLRVPLDAPLAAEFAERFEAAPPLRLPTEQATNIVANGAWVRSPLFSLAAGLIADVLLREAPDDLSALTCAAVVWERGGRHAEARDSARRIVARLLTAKAPDFRMRTLLTSLAPIWTASELDELLAWLRAEEVRPDATLLPLFVRAVLLEEAERLDEAAEAYAAAFTRTTAHRIINQRLIDVCNRTGRTVALVRLLTGLLTATGMEESFEWRSLSVAARQLYDPATALWAARRDASPIAPLQIMQSERLAGDARAVRTTLFRFLGRNRTENRFYSATWPVDEPTVGMAGYLDQAGRSWRTRVDMFTALADLPFAAHDFAGLWRAARAGQRDVPALAKALAHSAVVTGTDPNLAAELCAAAERDALTAADHMLAVALATAAPPATAAALTPVLERTLFQCDPNDVAELAGLADALERGGRAAQAAAVRRWCAARDALQGYAAPRADERLERIGELAGSEALAVALRALTPTPLDTPSDAVEAAVLNLATELEAGAPSPATAERIARLGEADQTEALPSATAAVARYQAARGQMDAFSATVRRVIAATVRARNARDSEIVDAYKMLPTRLGAAAARELVQQARAEIETGRAGGAFSRSAAVRALCLLGRWCADHELADEGRELLSEAGKLADPVGEPSLWVADLARYLGVNDVAVETERALLDAELLPVSRIVALLTAIEVQDGAVAADDWAVKASAYTAHPEILKRAERAGVRRGDEELAQQLRARGAVWSAPAATRPATPN